MCFVSVWAQRRLFLLRIFRRFVRIELNRKIAMSARLIHSLHVFILSQTLKHIGPASVIADYRALWLRLSKLTRDTGTATCYTFTFLNLYLFFVITLSVYGLMAKVSDGLGWKDIGLTLTVLSSVCLLFFICDEGHNASFSVKKIFQKKILMAELAWLSLDATVEINMFLRATEMNKASINLGGFFDVDRNLFKSVSARVFIS